MADRTLAELLAGRAALVCEVCGGDAVPAGQRASAVSGRTFRLACCPGCGFAFVVEPRTDFAAVYDGAYYDGRGADPSVDYAREITDAHTIRHHEWDGVRAVVGHLHPAPIGHWLDFGSGYGGLVRSARDSGIDAVGFEEGFAAARARDAGIPMLDGAALDAATGVFDVVTAIEVLEHVLDPVGVLRRISAALAPGGVLFVTTGNAARHQGHLDGWSYVVPDVHISFYEPRTLERAYAAAGLEPLPVGFVPGMEQIIRYKVLKGLRRRRRGAWERVVPWTVVTKLVDRRYGVSDQPAARRSSTTVG